LNRCAHLLLFAVAAVCRVRGGISQFGRCGRIAARRQRAGYAGGEAGGVGAVSGAGVFCPMLLEGLEGGAQLGGAADAIECEGLPIQGIGLIRRGGELRRQLTEDRRGAPVLTASQELVGLFVERVGGIALVIPDFRPVFVRSHPDGRAHRTRVLPGAWGARLIEPELELVFPLPDLGE
jgi:hypothetical protein